MTDPNSEPTLEHLIFIEDVATGRYNQRMTVLAQRNRPHAFQINTPEADVERVMNDLFVMGHLTRTPAGSVGLTSSGTLLWRALVEKRRGQ